MKACPATAMSASVTMGSSDAIREISSLSERVSQIARSLEAHEVNAISFNGAATLANGYTAQSIRKVIKAREARAKFFPQDLFADPAWDLLLELYLAELLQQRVSVSSACQAARVPPTTALRYIAALENRGTIVRNDDPNDKRRVYLSLSPEALDAMRQLSERTAGLFI